MPPASVENGLLQESSLRSSCNPGLQAMKQADKPVVDHPIRKEFQDSLDLDQALLAQYPNEPRWDYLLGHRTAGILALEVHPATDGEVQRVIDKKKAAAAQLRNHLHSDARVGAWYWAASGKAALGSLRSRARLATYGIVFVGRCLQRKHLQSATGSS